jgi:hypothetical protein
MSITRLRIAGAELGNLLEIDGVYTYGSGTFEASTESVYTGTYAYKHQNGSINYKYGYINITSTGQVRVGMWIKLASMISAQLPIIKMMSGGSDVAELYLSNGASSLYTNNVSRDSGTNWYGAWHHFGLDMKVDGTNGWVYIYKDGVLDMSWDGAVTGNITQVRFGKYGSNFTQLTYFDDIYIDDTTGESSPVSLPMLRFYYVTPDGNGNYAQWTGNDGNSTDNYLLVDEIPPSTSDYVQGTVADQYDSYTMTSITLADGQLVRAVIPTVYAKRNATTEELAIGTRYSSTDLVGTDQALSGTYALYNERQTTKPGGGDWEQTSLDGMELLIKSRGSY